MSNNDVPAWLAERLDTMSSGEIARAVRALQRTAARRTSRTPSTSPSTSTEPEPTKIDAAELAKIIRERMPY